MKMLKIHVVGKVLKEHIENDLRIIDKFRIDHWVIKEDNTKYIPGSIFLTNQILKGDK